jgi:1-acyl-sn-glycerol-3-phosphate acyltransferase
MTPPDRQKRPSARPSARAADKPQDAGRQGTPKANDAAKGQPARADSPPSQGQKRKHSKKQRIAARRSTPPEDASTSTEERARDTRPTLAEPTSSVARASADEAATDKTVSRAEPAPSPVAREQDALGAGARPTSPAKPSRGSAARAQSAIPAQARVPAEGHELADADEEHDVFGEGGAAGFSAVVAASAADAKVEPATRTLNRLTKSSRDEKRQREEAVLLSQSRELLGTAYYFRQYGAHGIRSLSAEVDDFGLDPHFEQRARPVLEAMVKRYFRVDVDGANHIPAQGRALIVANRAGALPWDGMVLRTAMRMTRPELSPVRWLAEDSIFHYPFLGVFMNRLGAVRACPENAERLLEQDRLVAVFPEGAQGSSKLFKERYRLQRFGRGGYVKLALKHGAPVIPTAIIGAEETNPLLGRARPLARALGASYLPITPTFPWLGPVGLLPAPVKWRIVVGEPIDLSSYGPEAADDALVVHRLNDQIRSILQALVEQARGSRRSVLFG